MSITRADFERHIKNFQFQELFNELGWDHAVKQQAIAVKDEVHELRAVAQKKDFLVFVCSSSNGKMPDANARKKIDREINKLFFEHLLIFIDPAKTRQIWQLSVKEPNKPVVIREITYHVDQNPERLYQKLTGLLFTFDEEGKIGLVDVLKRVSESFNVNAEKVTKKFYDRFKKEHAKFREFIQGIQETVDRDWYTSLMLNRLMFIYFIQKKGFLDGNPKYLGDKLNATQEKRGKDQFYSFYKDFLRVLFHKGLGAPENLRSPETLAEIGKVPYLNGGLFDVHQIEEIYTSISIPDEAFGHIFDFFDEYHWHLDTGETATGNDINPDVIGYIFEKYINDRAAMGAYYTKEDITEYISKNCIIPFLFEETKKECANAFREDSSLWQTLKENPDRYIYDAVKHGIWIEGSEDLSNHVMPAKAGIQERAQMDSRLRGNDTGKEIGNEEKGNRSDMRRGERMIRELPPEIAEGLDTTKPNLLERRKAWNRPAPPECALPTEIWREVVERRNRYFDIRNKMESGEINQINDFITYNLNIRQFAQDAIEQYEGSDFVNAFYKAVTRITVLDPACGSGAFLFAALNVLEPLYGASINRMREFVVEDDEQGGRKFPQFRKVLTDIEGHPNLRYYIYKSIILNNLYGVDIMKEAVEIAKLRLFLKLMAEVEQIDDVEPMPDIDYNIRAGNSLVGFATYEDLRKAIAGKGQSKLDLDDVSEKFKEQADVVGRAYRRFKEIQLESDQNEDSATHQSFKEAKNELEARLRELNSALDGYLANTYGVDPDNTAKFTTWKESHQPFHWFAEFYEIVDKEGGFSSIIGNPPYVEYRLVKKKYQSLVGQYQSEKANNLYTFFMERSCELVQSMGKLGMIVPTGLIGLNETDSVRKKLITVFGLSFFSTFAIRPSKLFDGVDQRLCIYIGLHHKSKRSIIFTTQYQHWHAKEREGLLACLEYTDSSYYEFLRRIPKLGNGKAGNVLAKIDGIGKKTVSHYYSNGKTGYLMHYHRSPRYWIRAMDFEQYFKSDKRTRSIHHFRNIYFREELSAKIVGALLNSSMFFFWFVSLGNGRNITGTDVGKFPLGDVGRDFAKGIVPIFDQLMDNYKENSLVRVREDCEFQEFRPSMSKHIIDEIDKILAKHYGFTEEELDFIINYDIKYRMGKEL